MKFTKKPWAGSLSPMQFDNAVKTVSHVLDEQFSVRLKPTRAQHVTASILGYQSLQQAQHALSYGHNPDAAEKSYLIGYGVGEEILRVIESETELQRLIIKAAQKSGLADYALQWDYQSQYETQEDSETLSLRLITAMITISYLGYHYAANKWISGVEDLEVVSLAMSPYEHEHAEDIGVAERLIFDAAQQQLQKIEEGKVELFFGKEKREFNYDSNKFIEAFSNREIDEEMTTFILSFDAINKCLSYKMPSDLAYIMFKGIMSSIYGHFVNEETIQEIEVPQPSLRANATFIRFILDMPRKHLKTAMKANQHPPIIR